MKTRSPEKKKGVSTLISTVLLLAIVFGLSAIISPWLFSITQQTTEDERRIIEETIICQSTKYDFDSAFGSSGVSINFSTSPDSVDVKVVNTGTINLHTFSLEIELENGTTHTIIQVPVNATYQKTKSLPLKPGQSAILRGNVSSDLNAAVREVKVLNGACPSNFIKQKI